MSPSQSQSEMQQLDPREKSGGRTRFSKAVAFGHENGVFLLLVRLGHSFHFGLRNAMIGSRLRASKFHVGRSPKLVGLNHLTIGRSFSAGDYIWIEAVTHYNGEIYRPIITIGDNVCMSDNVHIGSTLSVTIGDGALFGSRVTVIDHNHGIYDGLQQSSPLEIPALRRLSCQKSIVIGRNVWVGDGVVVLPGAHIGDGSIIGANSVVIGSIPEHCIAVGSPARPIRSYDFEAGEWVKWKPLD